LSANLKSAEFLRFFKNRGIYTALELYDTNILPVWIMKSEPSVILQHQ